MASHPATAGAGELPTPGIERHSDSAANKGEAMRRITLIDSPTASNELLTQLECHLPFSIPVLRRIQFAKRFPGPPGSTAFTHVLWAFYQYGEGQQGKKHFAAAYLDLSRGPETQCWIYCTLEDFFFDDTAPLAAGKGQRRVSVPSEEKQADADELVLAVLRRVWEISVAAEKDSTKLDDNGSGEKHTVLIGSLHETIRQRLLQRGVKMFKTKNVPPEMDWEFCHKWLFRVGEFPDHSTFIRGTITTSTGLKSGNDDEEGSGTEEILSIPWNPETSKHGKNSEPKEEGTLKLKFDKVKRDDIDLIRSRTSIDRKPETLLKLPSLVLRRSPSSSNKQAANDQESSNQSQTRNRKENEEKEEPIAWAFTGLDGTLMTLHVEAPYRGLGLAKLIAGKIMRDSLPLYGNDGWGAADVFVANTQSQGVCKSIGGKAWWTLSWALVDLDSVPGLPTFI